MTSSPASRSVGIYVARAEADTRRAREDAARVWPVLAGGLDDVQVGGDRVLYALFYRRAAFSRLPRRRAQPILFEGLPPRFHDARSYTKSIPDAY